MKQILILPLALALTGFVYGQDTQQKDKTPTVDTKRDARKHGPTADNQKDNEADRKTTADIRKAVYGDKSLSTMAHNVKIITVGGQVTLRGRVKSEEEKSAVVSKAEEVAGKGKVTDKLMIAAAKAKEPHPDK
jgi:hyperosmotically inducible protein